MTNNMKHVSPQGFTLIETLMAILVLTVSIVGPLTIASRGLNAALIAKDQTIAFYLAQDAVEYIRYQRDTNVLSDVGHAGPSTHWLDGFGNCLSTVGSCTIDSIADKVVACSGACPAINYDTSTNTYTYDSGSRSIFTRTITITTPVGSGSTLNANEAQVLVTVKWYDVSTQQHTVSVTEDLFNWE